ncbi:MAG: hypothetical protein A3H27_02385 [Acidobacteria bacterium RIFCSPLOWO2_02_FULL_59_13]|nr:MAG: hypothetical protein A3H27_02385 [Acidobacteria bacterium RIFCSPLOWO2_02_FULL_59_13]
MGYGIVLFCTIWSDGQAASIATSAGNTGALSHKLSEDSLIQELFPVFVGASTQPLIGKQTTQPITALTRPESPEF